MPVRPAEQFENVGPQLPRVGRLHLGDQPPVAGDAERELRIIRDDLHRTAVRVTGGDPERIELAAAFALDLGLEVWFSPYPLERVDWTPFDFLSVDLYRSAETAEVFGAGVRELVAQGKPVAITEFGSATFRARATPARADWRSSSTTRRTGGRSA